MRTATDDPAPFDEVEGVPDLAPVGAAPPDRSATAPRNADHGDAAAEPGAAEPASGAHAARASSTSIPVTLAYTRSSRRAIVGQA